MGAGLLGAAVQPEPDSIQYASAAKAREARSPSSQLDDPARRALFESELASREYWATETARGLQAPNRKQNLRSYFDPTGVRVHDRTADGSPRLLGLALSAMGRGEQLAPVGVGEVSHDQDRVEIRREGLVEWFENREEGLEQGFTLAEPPRSRLDDASSRGSVAKGPLVLELDIAGANATLHGEAVLFKTAAGSSLEYGKLVVVDARGVALASRFEVPDPTRVRLVVEDGEAAYPIVIDPLLTRTADAQLEADQTEAQLGLSVSGAGDVNGDGYGDVIVGAPYYDAGQNNEGAAFVFHGSASGISTAGVAAAATQLEGNQTDVFGFGFSVSGAGDVNGDGYDDVIVGGPNYSAGEVGEGAAFIFLGSASGIPDGNPSTAAAQLESNQAAALPFSPPNEFGQSVAGAGDLNGDGYDDVVVGSPGFDAGQTNEGAAFVFLGSASGIADGNPVTAAAQLESNLAGAGFGNSVASAGDVNADGYDDLVIAAQTYQSPSRGGVFVFPGSVSGIADSNPASPGVSELVTSQTGSVFGSVVSGAGDVDGDGYADVIVGAPFYDAGETDEGAAFVFRGGASGIADGNEATGVRLESNQAGSKFGRGVAGIGDVNGDGYADVAVGAYQYDAGQSDEGAAFVFLGGATGIAPGTPASAAFQLESNQVDAWLGWNVAGAGDVNGDGYADVISGVHLFDNGHPSEGAAFVYLGSSLGIPDGTPSTAQTALLEFGVTLGYFGLSAHSAGDVNGDGYGDVIVGNPFYDSGEAEEGAAFLFLGSATGVASGGPLTAAARLESNQAGAWFGAEVASAGDVNADGYGDVIVGAPNLDGAQTDEGGAFLFLGSASGISSGNPVTAAARFQGNQAGAGMGVGASSAGDVNGDGFGDLIVGAWNHDAGETDEGAAFVFLGAAIPVDGSPASAHAQLESNQASAAFGSAVASAGDVNGDGYGDVIVGAYLFDAGQGDEGAAFLFLGSSAGLAPGNPTTATAQYEANTSGGWLGWMDTVGSAGDVNGDGYDDVIVGAPKRPSPSGASLGVGLVFLGTSVPTDGNPVTAHALLAGIDSVDFFMGKSVASAGDVNGDGYGDVVVGAPSVGFGVVPVDDAEGDAFIFLGSSTGIADGSGNTAHFDVRFSTTSFYARLGMSVAAAGDVNGDGYGDVIVGSGDGSAHVFLGNRGGRPVQMQQRRDDGSGRTVEPGGAAYDADSFQVSFFAASPRGRERAKIEVEVCPAGSAFGALICIRHVSSSWVDLGTSGATLTESVPGLTANTLDSWRARALLAPFHANQPAITPIARPGPWHRLQNRSGSGDIRTVPEPGLVVGVMIGVVLLAALRRKGRVALD